jgi:predicted regulator of Ras-like GTPase activity (Roadblock/LC7/MglB family)
VNLLERRGVVENILADIDGVIGVRGSFVVNADGKVISTTLPSSYDDSELSAAGGILQKTIEGLQIASGRESIEMNLLFSDGRLVVKSADKGCLVMLCVPEINVALLNLTANIAVRKISEQMMT